MNILSFDTSTKSASVALVVDNTLVGEIVINDKRTHSQKLMPIMESLLSLANITINDIDLIGVCIGPGSFTGIRIAMATVKAISHVRDIPVIAVNSLESLVQNVSCTSKKIVPILDAQGKNVYTAIYSSNNGSIENKSHDEIEVIDIDELLVRLENSSDEYIVLGEAVEKYYDKISEVKNIEIVSYEKNISKASSVCVLGIDKYNKNIDVHSCYDISPLYIRKSQAEIQYEEKQSKLKNS